MIRIKELTALRGIFMVMIFLFHEHVFEGGGTLGVTFFFVLSGFSLTLGYKDKIDSGEFVFKDYFKKRLAKFYPLHWLTLMAALVLAAVNVYLTSFDNILIPSFIVNSLLLQSWVPFESFYLSFNSVSWYLADTLFFVALFPVIIRWINKTKKNIQYIVSIFILIGYLALIIFLPHKWYSPILYINPLVRLIDFVIGTYLAVWVKNMFFCTRIPQKGINVSLLVAVSIVLLAMLIIISLILEGDYKKYSFCYWPLVCFLILNTCLIAIYGGGAKAMSLKTKSYYGLVRFRSLSI